MRDSHRMSTLWIYAVFAALAAFVLLARPAHAANTEESQSIQITTNSIGADEI